MAAVLWAGLALGQGYSPEEAPQRMTVAEGFSVKLVAAEPMVRQPVAIEFDVRGRLWVIQYLQYPNPAGLTRVTVDRYSRTAYNRVPDPPPHGPKGADRITILEDTNGDGQADSAKDFVAGLNLASGLAFGHGGVFVLQVPYLLFYPDRNGDDVPDADPDVLLSGFGMEDAHSVANSLTFGPDGWLYGCQGSTVTANIRGIEFQQGVWRYHPLTRRFELFCEGGGNSWGLDFDRHGNLLYSTNVGGYVMLHAVQGGYYWKSFGKHGALHNPRAYGYFDHVPHENFHGGHVSVGGLFYYGDSFPAPFRGKYVAADLLGHGVYWHDVHPAGSSFRSAHGGEMLLANDTWFAPTDLAIGPDGAVYVADWHDQRTAHPDPDADWDRRNGRIYRIDHAQASPQAMRDFTGLASSDLVALLADPNDWYARRARQILADRRDPEVIFPLRRLVLESSDEHLALRALWALHLSGGLTEHFALQLLPHRSPHVRRWVIRLMGDEQRAPARFMAKLAALAATEQDASVRSQLASTARRLPSAQCLAIVNALLLHHDDTGDPYLPLLLWWAVEHHMTPAREGVVAFFASAEAWKSPVARETILPRLVRGYAAEGTEAGLSACAQLLCAAPTPDEKHRLLAGLDLGLRDRPAERSPEAPELTAELEGLWTDGDSDPLLIRVLARLGHAGARARAAAIAFDSSELATVRVEAIRVLEEISAAASAAGLLELIGRDEPQEVQLAALSALGRIESQDTAEALVGILPNMTPPVRGRAVDLLLSRPGSAAMLLEAVNTGKLPTDLVSVEQLRQVRHHDDPALDALVAKHWGSITGGTSEERLAEVRRLNNDLRAAPGDPAAGRAVFQNTCAACHKLGDVEGRAIGPDLTHANRKDRDYLLISIVDPSAIVRSEYLSYLVRTNDGQVLSGPIVEQNANAITLQSADGARTVMHRTNVQTMRESSISLMPEDLLKQMKPQDLRDLFAFLQGG